MTGGMTPETDFVLAATQPVLVDTCMMVGVIVIMDILATCSIKTGIVTVVTAARNGVACWLTGFTRNGAISIISTGRS
jgi:hypothetical protein